MAQDPMARLVEQLQRNPALPQTLPSVEGGLVRAALDGQSVHDIAGTFGMSEAAVWEMLGNAARMASGQPIQHPVETGGLGSDTDPGVTGGYGDTAMGSLEGETNLDEVP